jgi:phosphate transport system substrate-binding protein
MTIYSIIATTVITVLILVVILVPMLARRNFKRNRPATRGVRRIVIAGLIVVTLDLLAGCSDALLLRCVAAQPILSNAPPQCAAGSLTIDGSSALGPLVQLVANYYESRCSQAQITVQVSNSGNGLREVEDGSKGVMIGDSDVPASPDESDLVDHQVAVVIFCVIINKNVGVTNLSTDDLKGIYSGKLTNWSQVGGPDLPIKVFSRPEGSGTRATFQQYILGGPEGITTANPSATTDAITTAIANTPGSIGYGTLYETSNKAVDNVKVVSIDDAFPSADTIKGDSYHFWNIEHMYTKPGHTSPLADDFLAYMSSAQASQIARAHSFLSTTDIRDNMLVEINHCSS